jgi:RHS repeat-associated protein
LIFSHFCIKTKVQEKEMSATTYYLHKDHLGSIATVFLSPFGTTEGWGRSSGGGVVAAKYSYDAWGRRRNYADFTYTLSSTDPLNKNYFDRFYTGHETLPSLGGAGGGLINMNGRMYDPLLGRMLSPDNYVQAGGYSQSYNRYSYCINNPLKYTDPSGNVFVVDDVIAAAVIGGTINVLIQGMSGHINSAGDMGKAFLVGALAGAGGAVVGGAVAGAIGFGGFAGGATVGASSGFAGGFIGGAGNSWAQGGSFGGGLKAGLIGGGMGAVTGGLIGGVAGGIDAVRSDADFWNGTYKGEVGGEFGKNAVFLDEKISAGAKPTASGEVAAWEKNPNYGKYGWTRTNIDGSPKQHFGVDYVGNEGDEVSAMYNGKVIPMGKNGIKAYGKYSVRTNSVINGKTYNVDYGHLQSNVVTLNQTIEPGQTIGYMGRLGNVPAYAPTHVHIAVWRPVPGVASQGFVMPWWR